MKCFQCKVNVKYCDNEDTGHNIRKKVKWTKLRLCTGNEIASYVYLLSCNPIYSFQKYSTENQRKWVCLCL